MSLFNLIILGLIGGVLFYGISIYNKLVKQGFLVGEAWSGIDVQLKRRHDLVPALVETVKGYASHEQETLEEVVALRSKVQDEQDLEKREMGEKFLSRDIGKLFALAESYPDLKADKNFRELGKSLTEIEDDLQYARRYYNGTVRDYNVLILSFPSNLIASFLHLETKKFFELEYVTERKNPDVSFS